MLLSLSQCENKTTWPNLEYIVEMTLTEEETPRTSLAMLQGPPIIVAQAPSYIASFMELCVMLTRGDNKPTWVQLKHILNMTITNDNAPKTHLLMVSGAVISVFETPLEIISHIS